jgi:DNA polymerase-1
MSKKYMGGKPFNPASGPQTEVLLRRRGLEGEKKTKTGRMSTSKKSIEHLRFTDAAVADLEDWREHQKIRDSFAEPVLANWPDDASIHFVRVRCDLKISRVTSGRFSGALLDDVPSSPLLAIPVRTALGKSVRDCYEAEDGYILGSYDLDQAEMRLMADESGDARLVKLFREGKVDIHTDTASKMFGIPPSRVDKMKHRYPAKRVGFGVITGIQGRGLLDQLRMVGILDYDERDCDKFIRDWLKIYPGVEDYMKWCRSECRRQGGVIKDRWGMPRYLPAILDDSKEAKYDRLEAERQTHSHRIQGGAQGWLQNVMGWLWRELRPYGDAVRFILQIHDELLFEVARGLEEEVGRIIMKGMVEHGGAKLKVPVKSSGSWAHTWGKLKD